MSDRRPPADPPPSQDPEEELFYKALDELTSIPDKDATLPVTGVARKVRQTKAPKKLSFPPDATLDLHRKTVPQALEALLFFLQRSAHRGHETVLVVTGKGHGSGPGGGKLKGEVERWLRQDGHRYVRRFSEAPRKFGGSGAYLLTLR